MYSPNNCEIVKQGEDNTILRWKLNHKWPIINNQFNSKLETELNSIKQFFIYINNKSYKKKRRRKINYNLLLHYY